MPQWMTPLQNSRVPMPQYPWAAQHIRSPLCLQWLPISDIQADGTPVGHKFFTLALGLKYKNQDHSTGSTPEGQSGPYCTEESSISSGCSTLPIQLVASHNLEQPGPELINLPSNPVKAAADPNERLAAKATGSTVDHDRYSAVGDQ